MTDRKHIKSELQIRPSGTVSPEEKAKPPGQNAFYGQVLNIRNV
jgi:hypothetical protein